MTPERWKQIDELFHAALAHEPAERTAFLVTACGNDEQLRLEVESLISFWEGGESFIEAPADLAAAMLNSNYLRLEPGYEIDSYRLVRHVGTGGMGEVYLADDTRLHRQIALKLLPSRFMMDPDRARRFHQEARAASALNHPNIVTVHSIGWANSTHFIATEFVDGVTLRERLNEGVMTLGQMLDIAGQLASALSAAHTAGIVHRDIKPENIMLRPDGFVKVLDFGLAKLALEERDIQSEPSSKPIVHTNPGVVMGTVSYMSPEQARAGNVDARTDIWSLGVVMYEMVSGRTPFVGETSSHTIVAIIEQQPPLLSGIPDELDRIINKCLVKDREQRYQTVGDLLADLKRLKQRVEVDAAIGATTELRSPYEARTGFHRRVPTDDLDVAQPGSRFGHLVDGLRSSRRLQLLLAGVLVIVALITPVAYWRSKVNSQKNAAAVPQTKLTPVRSVLVLPLENQTENPVSEYLSNSIPESMSVQARGNKVIKLGGKPVDSQEEARALGVSAILTGRIAKREDDIVVSVELIDARDKSRIWSQEYTRKFTRIVLIQLEIAREISRQLEDMAFKEFYIIIKEWPTAPESK